MLCSERNELVRSHDLTPVSSITNYVADDWPVMEKVIGEPLPRLTKADLRLIPGGAA